MCAGVNLKKQWGFFLKPQVLRRLEVLADLSRVL